MALLLVRGSNMSGNGSRVGRPTKYKEEYAEQAKKLCLKGFTDIELADFFNVEEKTIYNWKNKYPDFLQAVTRGKAHYDDSEVVKAFNKRAVGFRYEEKVYERQDDGEMVLVKVFEKEHAPDAGACLNWLKNRLPDEWRDKPEQRQEEVQAVPVKIEFEVREPIKSK